LRSAFVTGRNLVLVFPFTKKKEENWKQQYYFVPNNLISLFIYSLSCLTCKLLFYLWLLFWKLYTGEC